MRRTLPVLLALSGLVLMARPTPSRSGQEPATVPKVNEALARHYSEAYSFSFHRAGDEKYHLRTLPQMIRWQTQKNGGVIPKSVRIQSPPPPPPEADGDVPRVPGQSLFPTAVQSAALNADLIVLGVPRIGRSLPTSNNAFVFSIYPVAVSRVVYDRRKSVTFGDTIVVSRGGGVLTVSGVKVTAITTGFPPFRVGHQYIFMLRFNPRTGTYLALAPWTFEVKGGAIWAISPQMRKIMPPEELPSFLQQLHAAVGLRRN